jgi:hypothetical protein
MNSVTTDSTIRNQSIDNTVTTNSKLQIDLTYASQSSTKTTFERRILSRKREKFDQVLETCRKLARKQGIYSSLLMREAGFQYINNGDTVRCEQCQLEVSGWTKDMIPLVIHKERSPNCDFIRSMCPSNIISTSSSERNFDPIIALSSNEEPPSKRQRIEVNSETCYTRTFTEVETLKEVRCRTFSHWPHQVSPSRKQMIDAGFFNCNVGDRTICLYCNLICQQWVPHTDDPWLVHTTLSPQCIYVSSMLACRDNQSILVVNGNSTDNCSSTTDTRDPFRSNAIVLTAAIHTAYNEIPKRHVSFVNWPNEALPLVDDLVRAGFFYTGTETIVTCFFCNGSLQNWGPSDNPTVEHARWFPQCAYAKQLCGHNLYQKIQESKRAIQGCSEFFCSKNQN